MRASPFFTTLACLSLAAGISRAEPEWNVAAQSSLCALGNGSALWQRTVFCGSLRGDVLFGRERNADFALGPYLSLSTAKFADARLGAGLSLLIPTLEGDFPVLLSAGGASRNGSDVRLAGELFFGLRSHNFHGAYAMASGIVLGGDAAVANGRGNTLYAGVQIDGLWLALPFILGYEWLNPTPDPGD